MICLAITACTPLKVQSQMTTSPPPQIVLARKRKRSRRQLAHAAAALHKSLERPTLKRVKAVLDTIVTRAAGRVTKKTTASTKLFTDAEFKRLFNRAMGIRWNATVWAGVEFEQRWIKDARGEQSLIQLKTADDPPPSIHVDMTEELQADVSKYLKERRVGVWQDVSSTTHDRIRRSIEAALTKGESLDEMAARIGKGLKSGNGTQAMRIARTETTATMNHGNHSARRSLNIAKKEWITRADDRVRGGGTKDRYTHISSEGQVRKNDKPFDVSGEQMLYPADSSLGASAGNVVNCRCISIARL